MFTPYLLRVSRAVNEVAVANMDPENVASGARLVAFCALSLTQEPGPERGLIGVVELSDTAIDEGMFLSFLSAIVTARFSPGTISVSRRESLESALSLPKTSLCQYPSSWFRGLFEQRLCDFAPVGDGSGDS